MTKQFNEPWKVEYQEPEGTWEIVDVNKEIVVPGHHLSEETAVRIVKCVNYFHDVENSMIDICDAFVSELEKALRAHSSS